MAIGKENVIGANLKFNQNLRNVARLSAYLGRLGRHLIESRKPLTTEVRVYPHDLALVQLRSSDDLLRPSPLIVGAQDIHHTEDGSFTRAPLSPQDLLSLKFRHTLIGHSETRAYFGVTDADVAKKLDSALKANILATVCIGDDIADKKAGKTAEVIERQIVEGILPAVSWPAHPSSFEIAYEPVYAIAGFAKMRGLSPQPASIQDIAFAHQHIRKVLKDHGLIYIAEKVKILYGGSSNENNTEELLSQPFIDGLLVGTASWDVQNFMRMIQIAQAVSQPREVAEK